MCIRICTCIQVQIPTPPPCKHIRLPPPQPLHTEVSDRTLHPRNVQGNIRRELSSIHLVQVWIQSRLLYLVLDPHLELECNLLLLGWFQVMMIWVKVTIQMQI